MALLPQQQRDELKADIMRKLSSARVKTPGIHKSDWDAIIIAIDTALETAEVSAVTSLPGGSRERVFLTGHPGIARRVLAVVEDKRREVL